MKECDIYMDRICANCGLSFGAHRGDNVCRNQCPEHESRMDWSETYITTFVDSGEVGKIPYGTPRI